MAAAPLCEIEWIGDAGGGCDAAVGDEVGVLLYRRAFGEALAIGLDGAPDAERFEGEAFKVEEYGFVATLVCETAVKADGPIDDKVFKLLPVVGRFIPAAVGL